MSTEASKITVNQRLVQQCEVELQDPDPDFDPPWVDRLTATWHESFPLDHPGSGWWLVCGDNTGSQSLIVHPYQVPGLIRLLEMMQTQHAERTA